MHNRLDDSNSIYFELPELIQDLSHIIDLIGQCDFSSQISDVFLSGYPSIDTVTRLNKYASSSKIDRDEFIRVFEFFKIEKRYLHTFNYSYHFDTLEVIKDIITWPNNSIVDICDLVVFWNDEVSLPIIEIDIKNLYLIFAKNLSVNDKKRLAYLTEKE